MKSQLDLVEIRSEGRGSEGWRIAFSGSCTPPALEEPWLDFPPCGWHIRSHLNSRMDVENVPWYRNLQDAQPFKLQLQLQVWIFAPQPRTVKDVDLARRPFLRENSSTKPSISLMSHCSPGP